MATVSSKVLVLSSKAPSEEASRLALEVPFPALCCSDTWKKYTLNTF